MKEVLLELAASIRGYTAEMRRYHNDVDQRYPLRDRKQPKTPSKKDELAAYIKTLEPGTVLPKLRHLDYYGSRMTVARYLNELSNPFNPRLRKTEDNRWIVLDREAA